MASADRLIEVFNEAKARAVGAERDRFLSEACQGDPELKKQVLSLLQAHEGAGDFLKHTQFIPPVTVLTEKPGDKIGHYKLLQKIGEGGCGVVYMAEQEEPVRRRVALKVIKLGMDTKQVVARFEAEGQALAMMDHPNIAKVFDAGATNTGRPYFVIHKFATRFSTRIRRASFIATSSHRTSSSPSMMVCRCPRSLTLVSPRPSSSA
jgi:serine/threonine protein kinase